MQRSSHSHGERQERERQAAEQVPLEQDRLHIVAGLPESELLSFRVTINAQTTHDSYSARRERDHNDLVLALALACWYAGRGNRRWTANDISALNRHAV